MKEVEENVAAAQEAAAATVEQPVVETAANANDLTFDQKVSLAVANGATLVRNAKIVGCTVYPVGEASVDGSYARTSLRATLTLNRMIAQYRASKDNMDVFEKVSDNHVTMSVVGLLSTMVQSDDFNLLVPRIKAMLDKAEYDKVAMLLIGAELSMLQIEVHANAPYKHWLTDRESIPAYDSIYTEPVAISAGDSIVPSRATVKAQAAAQLIQSLF